jgi:exodeoxyribonuclease V alpha subunit
VRADFVLVQRDEPAALLETLCELVVRRLPASLGIAPGRDLQVLVPMHRGAIGVEAVNRELQRVLNPNGEPIPGTPLRVGDKVMQVRNNYALEVYNGDVGSIEAVDTAARKVLVRLDDRMLRYELAEIDQLILAYACTVHKSQGSEYPAVVVVLHAQHHIMLQRNLLYTAVTRAKRQVVLLGQERALMTALRDDSRQKRFTRLAQRLAAP